MAGMDFDFEGALGGGFDSPGKFSYGQYNQEQMMQNPNAIKSLGLLANLQESQLNQQKKVMEMKKMEEDRQMEMLMKQAVAEASKQGPEAIASVYEQFGDAKTAMDIRQSSIALKKGGLEVNKLLTDQESAKRAAIMNQVASRIASLPANQRAQEWANLIPQVNAQMGTEIPENYSSGNLMGLMAVQRGVQDGLQTILSNPQTASMAEQPLRAMADPATEKYFNDLIAAKKASLGPDLVTRANQMPEDPNFEAQRKQVREQIDARDKAAYEADFYKYKLDPETEKAKEQAQYELGQEANAQAQALSNALAELSAKEKPTAADVARVQAMADSLYETQTPLVARDFNRGKEAPASPETQQTKTFTTKTDAKGNISFSESVKEAPAKDDGGVSAAMAGLTQSLQGLDLPPSTWVDPKDVKGPLSTIGKLQADLEVATNELNTLIDSGASDEEILAADDRVRQLRQGASAAAKTGGGISVNVETGKRPLSKKGVETTETKLLALETIDQTLTTLNNNLEQSADQVLTVGGRLATTKAQWKDYLGSKLKGSEIAQLEANASVMAPLTMNLFNTMVPVVGTTATDEAMSMMNKTVANEKMGPNEAKIYSRNQLAGVRGLAARYNELIDNGYSVKEAQEYLSSQVKAANYNLAAFARPGDLNAVRKIPNNVAELAYEALQDPKATEAQKAKAQKILEKFNEQ